MEKVLPLPTGVNRQEIGLSTLGKQIYSYRIGSGNLKVGLVFAIHGNEVGTVKLARQLLHYLYSHTSDFNNLTVFIVPILNVDGYDAALSNPDYWNGGRFGRFNNNNVDLNRNFDVASFVNESTWSFGKNYSEKMMVFCGQNGNSEPETKALTSFIEKENVKMIYSFHNSGGDLLPGQNQISKEVANIFSKMTGYEILSNNEWLNLKQSGTLKEWCDDKDISFLEVEGKTRWGSDWNNQKMAIIESLKHLNG